MKPLEGHSLVALGEMGERSLARYLLSLGAILDNDVASASFVIDDLGQQATAHLPIPETAIHVSVTPFGSNGPRAGWRGSELVASAMGGALRVTGEMGLPPVKEAGDACIFHADMVAASGAMAAHFARGRTGVGQHVDISVQQVTFSRNYNGVLVWQFDRRKLHRVGGALAYGKAKVRAIWKLADGWCFHSLMTGRLGAPANQALSDWMDDVGADNPLRDTDWSTYNRSTLPSETRATWEAAIAAFFAGRTKRDIATTGHERGINACVVNEPGDVLADPHLADRRFFDTSDGLPDRFAIVDEGARSVARAPAIHAGSRPGPLSGVKVLDFAWALVGSITTKTLGDLGADIVKVESRTRPDLARLDVQVSASEAGNLDDKPWFAHLNSSKRSLSLNMKERSSREILEPLIDWADVVVENFSPGTMDRLGLGYRALAERNPAVIMCSGSVFGQTGPMAQEWGVDGTGGALSGRTYLTGYPERDPVIPGAVPYGDVIVPYVMAAHISAALQRRRETGRGARIDASMYEICVQQMRCFLAQAQKGERPRRLGNGDPAVKSQGVYAAAGDDRWVALSIFDDIEQAKLDALSGGDVARWIAGMTDAEAVAQLQAAGLAAGVVQDAEDMIEHDPQLAFRGALIDLDHPLLGPFGHVATPMTFSRDTLAPYRAPRMGEHTREIATSICGLDDDRFDALQDAGVFK
ncbi:CoA transferase [Pelagerythrobacter marensis]|uniref:CoA transferase n=1 Tax=Pelagerythrobacter marensis TaxID=543877 RepID=A0ABZ2D6T3_9SPHN